MALYVGSVLAIGRAIDRRQLSDYGLGLGSRWRVEALGGFTFGCLIACLTVIGGLIVGALSVEGTTLTRETGLFAGLSLTAGTLTGLSFVVLFVFLYELVFRGIVLINVAEGLAGVTTDRTAVLSGVFVSAALFAAVHAPLSDFAPVTLLTLFVFSIVVGSVVAVTGRLAGAVGIHAGWAILVGPVFGTPFRGIDASSALFALEQDGSVALTGGSFGLDGGLLVLPSLLTAGACLLVLVRYGLLDSTAASRLTTPDLRD
jgi:hypothetical protein